MQPGKTSNPAKSVPRAAKAKSFGPRPLAALIAEGLDPVTRKRGFAGAELFSNWIDIVGERLARHSRPLALRWPVRGEKADPEVLNAAATLDVAVTGAFAIELQHAMPLVVERLNALFGWRCVERLKLIQKPITPLAPQKPEPPPLSAAEYAALEERLRKIDDPELKQALLRLGDGVIRKSKT